MKRLISFILALCMLGALLCSCKESANGTQGGSGSTDNTGNTDISGGSDNSGNENDGGDEEMDDYICKAEVLAVKGGANGIVVLQHDDGNYSTAVVMDKILHKYGLVADVAMLSKKIWNTTTDTPKADAVAQWRGILDTGRWKMVSHSHTHTWWGTATDNGSGGYNIADNTEKMIQEIVGSQQMIRAAFPDQRVLTFAYPGFSTEKNKYTDNSEAELLKYIYSEAARELIGETYIAGRRVQAAYSVTDTDIDWTMSGCYHIGGNYTNSYVERAIKNGTLNVLYVHNVAEVPEDQLKTYEYPSNTMAAYYFEDTCKKLAAAVADGTVWNTHYEDAIMYLREAQSAAVAVSGDKSGLKIVLTDEMDDDIYNFPLTVKIAAHKDWQAVKVTQGDKVSYAKVEYEAYEFYGGEYYAFLDIVPDGGEATVEPIALSEMPEVKPEEPKPTPTIPEPEAPAVDPNRPADAKLYASFNFNDAYGTGFTETSTCSAIERATPEGRDSAALHISKKETDATDRFFFDAGGKVTDAKEVTISYSFKLTSSFSGFLLQTLSTDSPNKTPYNLTIKTAADGFYFRELPGGKVATGKYSYNDWHTLELKMSFGEDGSFLAVITVDGAEAARSTNFTSSLASDTSKPSRTISRMGLYFQKASTLDIYIDDVIIYVK